MSGSPGDGSLAVSACAVALVLLAVVTPAAVGAAGQTTQPEADNTVTRIQVSPSGSAEWTIRIRTRLDSDERVAEYEAFQERFRENTSQYLDPFRRRIGGVVANAANATGREMRAVNVTASTSIQQVPRRWGVVTYRFTWTDFAAERDGRLVVGDVFQGGFFLAANDTLEIESPQGYDITTVEPAPDGRDDGVLTWGGRTDFADRHPRVVLAPSPDGETPTDTEQSGTSPTAAPPTDDAGLEIALGVLLLLGLLAGGAYAVWRRRDASDAPTTDRETATATEEDGATAEPTAGTATEASVMTDSERVQKLLEANGGRIRQAEIADEFDWSASKTSRVVGKMVEEGTVEKLQLGRENLIDLVEEE